MLLDPVAADFPDLQIIMAHPSVPWQDEALAVATHKHNTWIDLSGWSPKYFPAELVRYANSLLKTRVLFGSDFPLLTPDRWIRDAEQTALKPEVMPGIMKHNAARLLGLGADRPPTQGALMTPPSPTPTSPVSPAPTSATPIGSRSRRIA